MLTSEHCHSSGVACFSSGLSICSVRANAFVNFSDREVTRVFKSGAVKMNNVYSIGTQSASVKLRVTHWKDDIPGGRISVPRAADETIICPQ